LRAIKTAAIVGGKTNNNVKVAFLQMCLNHEQHFTANNYCKCEIYHCKLHTF